MALAAARSFSGPGEPDRCRDGVQGAVAEAAGFVREWSAATPGGPVLCPQQRRISAREAGPPTPMPGRTSRQQEVSRPFVRGAKRTKRADPGVASASPFVTAVHRGNRWPRRAGTRPASSRRPASTAPTSRSAGPRPRCSPSCRRSASSDGRWSSRWGRRPAPSRPTSRCRSSSARGSCTPTGSSASAAEPAHGPRWWRSRPAPTHSRRSSSRTTSTSPRSRATTRS